MSLITRCHTHVVAASAKIGPPPTTGVARTRRQNKANWTAIHDRLLSNMRGQPRRSRGSPQIWDVPNSHSIMSSHKGPSQRATRPAGIGLGSERNEAEDALATAEDDSPVLVLDAAGAQDSATSGSRGGSNTPARAIWPCASRGQDSRPRRVARGSIRIEPQPFPVAFVR